MSGKIKAGLGGLIGNSGEHYVMAELLKRDVIAALAPRNAPGFDILATKGEQTVRIRVKTKSENYDVWQYSAKKDGSIFRDLSGKDDFSVLVHLAIDHRDMMYFVIPTLLINNWLEKDFKEWLATPGKGGRPHSPTNPKRNLKYEQYRGEIEKFRNNWENLWGGDDG